jgi:tetratricopeptide (TPR) repeat protein
MPATRPPRHRRPRKDSEAAAELRRIAGARGARVVTTLEQAAEAFTAGRERDALRILRPLMRSYPDAAGVRELAGLCQYRIGNYRAAERELDAFVEITGSTDQHPVLMDCARALKRYKRVDELWQELGEASPSAELVTEGRIVYAGSLADRGRRDEAIGVLEKRARDNPRRIQDHHARLWYALADLYERAGDIPRARVLFLRVKKHDAQFADVAERLASLG